MKIIIACFVFLFLASCVHHIPDGNVVIKIYSPSGPAILLMEKGYLDKENHDKNWIYKHEWNEKRKGKGMKGRK